MKSYIIKSTSGESFGIKASELKHKDSSLEFWRDDEIIAVFSDFEYCQEI